MYNRWFNVRFCTVLVLILASQFLKAQKKSCDCVDIQKVSGYEMRKNGNLSNNHNVIIDGFIDEFDYGSPKSHMAFVEAKILKDSIKVKVVSAHDKWAYNAYFEKVYTKLLNKNGIKKVPKMRTYVYPILVSAMHKADILGVSKEDCKYYEKRLKKYFRKKRYYIYDPLCIIWMGFLLD